MVKMTPNLYPIFLQFIQLGSSAQLVHVVFLHTLRDTVYVS